MRKKGKTIRLQNTAVCGSRISVFRSLCVSVFWFFGFSVLCPLSSVLAEETITITTYYPSPNGMYDKLGANKLAVDISGVAVPSEYAAMSNGDAHIGRSLIVGAGGGSGYAYDEGAASADGKVMIKGSVGIGTTNPQRQLHIVNSSDAYERIETTGAASAAVLEFRRNGTTIGNLASGATSDDLYLRTSGASALHLQTNNIDRVNVLTNGNVGIGTGDLTFGGMVSDISGPALGIQVGTNNCALAIGRPSFPNFALDVEVAGNWKMYDFGNGASLSLDLWADKGKVGIGKAPHIQAGLSVAGSIHSNDTASGYFLGSGGFPDNWLRVFTLYAPFAYHDLAVGQFYASGLQRYDLSEVTPVKEEDALSQGEVVVIDRDEGLRVMRSTRPYDTAVYGIVSSYEQASMVIGGDVTPENAEKTKDKLPIALIGRVAAKISAENGPVKAGDALTTSSTPGHLMKCDDRTKCIGAIAGKALEEWKKGKGTIKIFVTLQ